jgi:hypothetical protein
LNRAYAVQPDWLIAGGESGHGARPKLRANSCSALGNFW